MNRAMTLVVGFLLIGVTLVSGSGIVYLTSSAGSSVVLSVTPAIADTSIGGSFAVAVNVSNVRDLGKWEMAISWNASVIDLDQTSGNAVAEGPFLRSANAPTKFQFDPYTSGSGVLSGVSCSILQAKGASGTGSVVYLRFKAIGEGATSITINDGKLYDYMGRIMIPPPSIVSGKVNVNSASVAHDVKIAAFDCPTSAVAGQSELLNVTVENLGISDENGIQVRLDVNGSLCKSIITSVSANSHNQTCFNWTASPVGTLSLAVSLVLVSEDMNLTNNVAWKLVTVVASSLHDLAISLSPTLPDHVTLGGKVWVNATIVNLGSFPEDSFASICIDNESVKTEPIYELAVGSSCEIWYHWIPSGTGAFNIVALVTCVPFETNTSNNRDSKNVMVISLPEKAEILVVSDDDGYWHDNGTSLQAFVSAISAANRKYEIWKESENGRPTLDSLLQYTIVIWTTGDYCSSAVDVTDGTTLNAYLLKGGNILIEGKYVAWDNYPPYSGLRNSVLHLNFAGSTLATGLTPVDSNHRITQGLPSAITWKKAGALFANAITPSADAFSVVRFSNTDFAAVNVFDGTQQGVGSVIYYSFSLQWLGEDYASILVENCIEWFKRSDVSTTASRMIFAPENFVHFIYAYPETISLTEMPVVPAGSITHALCKNPQNQSFSNAQGSFSASETNNALVALFGGPQSNSIINHYESETELPPIKCLEVNGEFTFSTGNGDTIISMPAANVTSGHSDAFVIYVFTDINTNNNFLVMYGFGWKGSWAAETYFDKVISRNLSAYGKSYYVFNWTDSNDNGIPELPEIALISSG